MCRVCQEKTVYVHISGRKLCKSCFLRYVEKKVRRTIRLYNLIQKGDLVVVGVSGGKDSLSLLDLLCKIYPPNSGIDIRAVLVDEGIAGYREHTRKKAEEFCKTHKIKLTIVSYKDTFGFQLDSVVKGQKPCSICGVLRRYLLNKKARDIGASKLATGHNLDDEAQSIIMNQFRRNLEASARLGPMTGIVDTTEFVRRIKPLYFMTEKEMMTYAYLTGLVDDFCECPYNKESYRNNVRDMLNKLEDLYPGTKHSILHSFLEILPLLKEKYKNEGKMRYCQLCNEPCSQEVCQKCHVLETLNNPKPI